MRLLIAVAFLIGLAAAPTRVAAHDGPHEIGSVQSIGSYHTELVVTATDATLIVHDSEGRNVDVSGLSGTAQVVAKGNQRRTVEFKPAGENRLAAPLGFPVEGKFRALLTLKNAQGVEIGNARYNIDVGTE